jgi:hypothetical protein
MREVRPGEQSEIELRQKVEAITAQLENYLQKVQFKGYDPHDGLLSPLLFRLSLKKKFLAIFWLQLIKNLPFNLRPLLGISPQVNPKALALFLRGFLIKYKLTLATKDLETAEALGQWLLASSSSINDNCGWGYPFPWANRSFFAPARLPNIVVTSFAGQALLDLYETTGKEFWLEKAYLACQFLLKKLHRTFDKNSFCFSYTPIDQTCIHNANLLGAALLARMSQFKKESDLKEKARQALLYSLKRQQPDGFWYYGEAANQRWVDSFHQGYCLEALAEIASHLGWEEIQNYYERGINFYRYAFILPDGRIKFGDKKIYPLDAHAAAEAIICFSRLPGLKEEKGIRNKIVESFLRHFWLQEGYFAYQRRALYSIKIPYLRWVQAWAFLALQTFLAALNEPQNSKRETK